MDDRCYKCGKGDILWLRKGRYICDSCKFRVEPPIVTLVHFWEDNTDLLYNTGTMRYEQRPISEFVDCGFQIHIIKTFFTEEISPLYKEVFVLRYFGDYICKKVAEYLDWPIEFLPCPSQKLC